MDINELIVQAVKEAIAGPATSTPGTQPVLVRGDGSGVFLGRIVDVADHGRVVTLDQCRHVWSWNGALNVADLARIGPSSGKIAAAVDGLRVLDAIEIVPVTAAAIGRFEAVAPWEP